MPTTIYDSSLLTQRKRDKTISNSFLMRTQQNTVGFPPLLGTSEQSSINNVKMGNMTYFTKNSEGKGVINGGCPCISNNPVIQNIMNGWATSIGGIGSDQGVSISTDSNGNVYVTGVYSSNPVTINNFVSNPGSPGGSVNITPYGTLSNSGSVINTFIIKYNSSGSTVWATSIGGIGSDRGNGISSDSNGNVYVTGAYSSNPVTINNFVSNPGSPGGSVNITPYGTLSNSGSVINTFIVKYNSSGSTVWATSIGGIGSDQGVSISTDSNGNVYVTGGYSSNPVTINNFVSNPGSPGGSVNITPYGTLSNSGFSDTFIVKYKSDGTI
jgi:hypothetical protein